MKLTPQTFFYLDDLVEATERRLGLRRGDLGHYEATWNAARPDTPYANLSLFSWMLRRGLCYEGNGGLAGIEFREAREDWLDGTDAAARKPWRADNGDWYVVGCPDGPWLEEPLEALLAVLAESLPPDSEDALIRCSW